MKKIRKILKYMLFGTLISLIIMFMTLEYRRYSNPDEIPSVFGFSIFKVLSSSMESGIKVGDIIISKKVLEEDIEVGDIISFKDGKHITTHRITDMVDINGVRFYTTKGDANNVVDMDLVKFDNVQGKVVCVLPKIGKWL